MDNTFIVCIVLFMLCALLVLLGWHFDQRLYVPFLKKMNIVPVTRSEFNPDLLRLGMCAAGCGILCYAVVVYIWIAMM